MCCLKAGHHRNANISYKKKVKYENVILSSDSRYFWSVAFNRLTECTQILFVINLSVFFPSRSKSLSQFD